MLSGPMAGGEADDGAMPPPKAAHSEFVRPTRRPRHRYRAFLALEQSCPWLLSLAIQCYERTPHIYDPEISGVGGEQNSEPSGKVSIIEAVSKQLGLKLELEKRPFPTMIIDSMAEQMIEE